MDRVTFAAARRGVQDSAMEILRPAVRAGLERYGPGEEWQAGIVRAAARVWNDIQTQEDTNAPPSSRFKTALVDSLDQTTRPSSPPDDAQVDRITQWLAAWTVNASTLASVEFLSEGDQTVEWVTMEDDAVRPMHAAVDGQVTLAGEPFNVGGHELRVPGEPVGPPEVWINCRCVLRPSGGDMPEEFAQETVIEEVATEEEIVDESVPWHGVLAPVGVESGDGRMLAVEGLDTRALPIPLKWQKFDADRHDASFIVGNIEKVWQDGNLIKAQGRMANTAEGNEAIGLMADGMLRGVSVDVDRATSALQNRDGSVFDFEAYDPETDDGPIEVLTEYRISAATLCSMPAFQEAFAMLGPWEDADAAEVEGDDEDEALVAGACLPCEAAAALEAGEAALGVDEFRAALLEALGRPLVAGAAFAPGTKDGPGWVTNPKETQQLRRYWTKGAGAAKIAWGTPGDFNRCRAQLAKYVTNPDWLAGTCANLHKVALGVWPGQEAASLGEGIVASASVNFVDEPGALVASARNIPGAWFIDPELPGPTPLTITDEGQIFGHVATWGVCHTGLGKSVGQGGNCVTAPYSNSNYAYFRTGLVKTDVGDFPVGHITMGIGHAGMSLNATESAAHYDRTDAVVADVAAGEDAHGIWFSGALRPGVTDEQIATLRSAAISGDWRQIGAGLEMVAALAVNVPGFPIPRVALAASASTDYALVAASPVTQPAPAGEVSSMSVKEIASAVLDEMEARQNRQVAINSFRTGSLAFADPAVARIREAFLA